MARRRRLRRPGALTELPPLRIVSQIAALQAIYYAAAVALGLFTALAAGTSFGAANVLGWEGVRGDTTQGWLAAFVVVLGGFCLYVSSFFFFRGALEFQFFSFANVGGV